MIFLNVRPKSTACLLISTNMQSTNLHAIRLHDNYITDSMSQLQLPTRIATPSQLQTGFLWSKSHIQLLGTDNGRSSMQNPGSKKPRCPLSSAPYLLFFFSHLIHPAPCLPWSPNILCDSHSSRQRATESKGIIFVLKSVILCCHICLEDFSRLKRKCGFFCGFLMIITEVFREVVAKHAPKCQLFVLKLAFVCKSVLEVCSQFSSNATAMESRGVFC